jgi:predicted flavoprotein YhiN
MVLIIGAGAAGMMAAISAARKGAKVLFWKK